MHRFETLVGSEDVTHHKPDPEAVWLALRRMEAGDKAVAWMVGDTPMDVEAARRAGIGHCAVSCGYTPAEELEKCAECVVSDALEAVRRIAAKKSCL
jgi:phosphoglycolate phosphatase